MDGKIVVLPYRFEGSPRNWQLSENSENVIFLCQNMLSKLTWKHWIFPTEIKTCWSSRYSSFAGFTLQYERAEKRHIKEQCVVYRCRSRLRHRIPKKGSCSIATYYWFQTIILNVEKRHWQIRMGRIDRLEAAFLTFSVYSCWLWSLRPQ